MEMTGSDYFSGNYAEARARFLEACSDAGATIESHQNPNVGPLQEELWTDVARLGPPDADAVLVLCSGTHGVEGFCGSAIQTGLLKDGLTSRLARQRAVLVHALNPYGFACLRRANEDNVDLNRNFVDHSKPRPANPDYDALAAAIAPKSYWSLVSRANWLRLYAYWVTHGRRALQAALTRGQYDHPQGLFYGGRSESWSNKTLRRILASDVAGAARVACIDIHTGLGRFGYGELITNQPPASAEYRRAVGWWDERVKTTQVGESVSAHVSGSIRSALAEELPQAEVTTVALEFGTYPPQAVLRALQAENWLHHHGGANHPRASRIKANLLRAFIPQDQGWKRSVREQAREVVDRALAGLAGSG
jgi:hypothetical protein